MQELVIKDACIDRSKHFFVREIGQKVYICQISIGAGRLLIMILIRIVVDLLGLIIGAILLRRYDLTCDFGVKSYNFAPITHWAHKADRKTELTQFITYHHLMRTTSLGLIGAVSTGCCGIWWHGKILKLFHLLEWNPKFEFDAFENSLECHLMNMIFLRQF